MYSYLDKNVLTESYQNDIMNIVNSKNNYIYKISVIIYYLLRGEKLAEPGQNWRSIDEQKFKEN